MVVAPVAARLFAALAAANAAAVWIAFAAGGAILGPVTVLLMPWYLAAAIFAVSVPSLLGNYVSHPAPRVVLGLAGVVLAASFLLPRMFVSDTPALLYSAAMTSVSVIGLGTTHVLRVFARHNAALARVCTTLTIAIFVFVGADLIDSLARLESFTSLTLAVESGVFSDLALLCASGALWAESYSGRRDASEVTGRRIIWIAGVAVVAVVVVARLSSTFFTYRSSWEINGEFLQHSQSAIGQALTAEISSAVAQNGSLGDLSERPATPDALQVIADRAVRDNKHYVAYRFDGRVVASAGTPSKATLALPLEGIAGYEVLWDGRYILRARLPVRDFDGRSGELQSELPLAITGNVIADLDRKMDGTGRVIVCAIAIEPVLCLPVSENLPLLRLPRAELEPTSAVALAAAGASGATSETRPSGMQFLSAYGALPGTGLAVIVAREWNAILLPVRLKMFPALLLLVATAVIAILVMRSRVRPLVQELIAARQSAEASEARFIAAAENSPDGFSTFDAVRDSEGRIADFRLTYQNASAAAFWQVRSENARGQLLSRLLPETADQGVMERYTHVVDTGAVIREESSVITPGVQAEWLEHLVVRLGDGIAVTIRDITERKKAENRLKHLAQNDTLTGLPNRAVFYDRLDHALVRARRTRRPMAVLFMDVDHFKAVNDRHGHSAGDALLRKFSERLRRSVRKADTVARLAGDEFTIILEELHDRADVEKVAETILRTIRQPLKLGEHDINITASMGIAIYTGENIGSTELLDRADLALYDVKRRGRDAFVVYSREMDTRGTRETSPEIVCLSGTWKSLD